MYTFDVKHRIHFPTKTEKIVQRNCINVRIHRRLFPSAFDCRPGLGFAIWFLLTLRKKPDEDFEEDET